MSDLVNAKTIFVLLVILATVVAFVGLSVYWEFEKVHLEPNVQAHLDQIDGDLDTELMGDFLSRESQYMIVDEDSL